MLQFKDIKLLAAFGLTVEFPKKLYLNIKVDDPRVVWDQSLCRSVFRAFAAQLKYKLGSMLSMCKGFPHCTALLVGDDGDQRARGLEYLQDAYETVATAKVRGSAALLDLVAKTGSDSPLMAWTGKVLTGVSFMNVPDLLDGVLREFWEANHLDKFEEDKLKFVRERETRSSNHKQVSLQEIWHAPTHHSLLKDYGRQEVERSSAASVPTAFDFAGLFKVASRVLETDEDIRM